MIDVPVPINLIDTPRATLEHDDPNDKAAQSMIKEVSDNFPAHVAGSIVHRTNAL